MEETSDSAYGRRAPGRPFPGRRRPGRPRTPDRAAGAAAAARSARDRLVIEHLELVNTLARRLAHRLPVRVDVADLIGAGMLGLIEVAARYNASTGVPFDAFARRRVHGAMLDVLRGLDWAPRSVRRRRRQIDAVTARLRHDLRREPLPGEIARAMEVSDGEFERLHDQVRALEAAGRRHLEAGADGDPLERSADPDDTPEAILARAERRAHLVRAVAALPRREQRVIALYYGRDMTMAQIGRAIGVCESRVSQLRSLALSRLRVLLDAAAGGRSVSASHPPAAAMRFGSARTGHRRPEVPGPESARVAVMNRAA